MPSAVIILIISLSQENIGKLFSIFSHAFFILSIDNSFLFNEILYSLLSIVIKYSSTF